MTEQDWTVEGYRRIKVMMRVLASSREEAIEKARREEYHDVDTEPDCDLDKPAWTARRTALIAQEREP